MRRSVASSNARPINCNPMGRPSRVNPQGTEIAGRPVKLAGRHVPTSAGRTPICFAIDLHGFRADGRGGDGNRGRDDGVDVLKGRVKFGQQALSHVKPRQITMWPARFRPRRFAGALLRRIRRREPGNIRPLRGRGRASASEMSVAASSDSFKCGRETSRTTAPRFSMSRTAASAARRTSASSFSQ